MKAVRIYIIFSMITFIYSSQDVDRENNAQKIFQNNDYGISEINLIDSDIYNTSIEIIVKGYQFIKVEGKDNYYKIKLDKGTPILKKGFPDLPKMSTSVIVPDYSKMKIDVVNFEYKEISNINIIPSKGNLSREEDPAQIPYYFGKEYNSDNFYPANLVELGEPYIVRDLRGQGIVIQPFQYNPQTKVLRIYTQIDLQVQSTSSIGENTKNIFLRRGNQINQSNEFKNIYKNLFINYNRDTRFQYLSDQGNMLVICYDDFIDEMNEFVEWKNKKGIHTDIFGVSSIGNNVDDIKDFVENYYLSNGLTYLLLVGDVAQIPTPIVNGASSDPSYGFIEGNDSFAEVIVGRFSANNPSELVTQIDRSIQYERDPSANISHFSNALSIASNQGPGYGGYTDNEFNDFLWDSLLDDYTYTNFISVYDPNGSVEQAMSAINEGVGIINYTGHSGPTGWGNGAPMSVNDVHNLENNGKLPFIFTVGCNPGEFNTIGECFCEAWLRATDDNNNPIGAVGHFGSTISQSWEPPMHGQWAMNAILTESYDDNLSRSYGGIAVNGCMHMNEAQGSYGINETNHWTLFGDPSLLIRTDEPTDLNISFNNNITIGQSELILDIGIDGALAALSLDGELITYSISDGGIAVLDLINISDSPGEVDLVVTSFNTFPYEETLQITSTDGAFLVYSGHEILYDNNFNDSIEYGENIEMNLYIENIGNFNTSAINLTASSSDEYISMVDENSLIAYALSGSITITENPISFDVLNNVPDGHIAQIDINLDDGDNSWQTSFSIEIHAPVFEIANLVFQDEGMDGIWDAGEIVTVQVDLINSGSASFYQYPGAIISCDNPYVNILSGENDNTYFGIEPNMSYEGIFTLESDSSTPGNTLVDLLISWGYSPTSECENDCVEQATLNYSTIIGHPSILIWDPSSMHLSGDRLVAFFNENNIGGFDYVTSEEVPSSEHYSTAFIFLGIYSDNYTLDQDDVVEFVSLLENGGNIYLEGGDTWAFNTSTSLHDMFGISGVSDGSSDLSTIVGVANSFTDGMVFEYNGGNSYVDRLSPDGGFAILKNSEPEYTTAIAYENMSIGYRTIGASHELGGLQGNDFTNYINGIFDFFNNGGGNGSLECTLGDVNSDGIVDVTDIIRQINIIINFGVPPTDYEICASDLNSDGIINVLDIVLIVNIIFDRRLSSERLDPISKVTLLNEQNSLKVINNGVVRGIQLSISSDDSDIKFNDNLDMNIAHNYIGNTHLIIIYNLDNNYLDSGEHLIFSSKSHFIVEDCIVSNVNNDSIDVLYDEVVYPDTFVLKQNYPNPFNPTTQIEIELGISQSISLLIYDIKGRKVRTLANGMYSSGMHSFTWDSNDDRGNKVASGMYIYSLISKNKISSQKMLLLK